MYTVEGRIRYSETDEQKRLTIPGLINYFQDCSTFQSEDIGAGLAYMEELHMVWVLASWQVEIKRLPVLGERIVVGTVPYDFKAFLGYRNFILMTPEGETLCIANSLWSLLDTDTKRPVNTPTDMKAKYPLEKALEMDYAVRKIPLSEERQGFPPFEVGPEHLDANHHVNNGKFISMAAGYLSEGFQVSRLRAEYKKQAFLGDRIYPHVFCNEDSCVVSLESEDKKPFVIVEFVKTV